jgi:demethylmenaquinone methyltransferase/2-methoxy-6-polyprenyl-1,4-benzoquinol methylase
MNDQIAMFDRVARRYDDVTRWMSLGLGPVWRRRLASQMPGDSPLLDMGTGTGDVALAMALQHPESTVVGVDLSEGMLEVGREKIAAAGVADRVRLERGDAQALPFDDDGFAGAASAFGIRNVDDRRQGLAELVRVTRPGGVVAFLEVSLPKTGLTGAVVHGYIHRVLPKVGAWVTGRPPEGRLAASITSFPSVEAFSAMMSEAGLTGVTVHPLLLGAVHLYVGTVPSDA